MGLIDRIARDIARGTTEFDPAAVQLEAELALRRQSPLRVGSLAGAVANQVTGLGIIQPLVDDQEVSDVLVNGTGRVWADRGSGLEPTEVAFESASEISTMIERALAPLGLRVDRSSPMVDARLPDGSRFHAIVSPAAVEGPLVAIRRFTQRVTSLQDLIEMGAASAGQVEALRGAVADRKTIVVSGGTGAGKTTLLNLLASTIETGDRIVTVEDAAELDIQGHVVRLEARPPNAEGTGAITIRQLLRSALRLRPDRIIVGEVRGPEALDLITALNTGHSGSLTTVHANSPAEALLRLETLAMTSGEASEYVITRQLRAAVDLVVQIERTDDRRRIVAIEPVSDRRDPG